MFFLINKALGLGHMQEHFIRKIVGLYIRHEHCIALKKQYSGVYKQLMYKIA